MTEQLIGKIGEGSREAVIAICTLTSIQNKAYATHMQFAFKLAKDNPDFRFWLYMPYRMSIANFRNSAANFALNAQAEYLMFVDDDAVLVDNSDMFKKLKDKIDDDENKHIVMPVVYVRGYPFDPMFFKFETDPKLITEGKGLVFYKDWREQPVDERNLLEVGAIGCHTCLIKTEVFKGIEEPYFITTLHNTEDVYFCMKLRDYYENIGIYVATDIHSSHLLDPLYVNETNVDIFKEFYERLGMDATTTYEELNYQPEGIEKELKELGEDFER
jgi:hypothetical protein